MKKKFLIVFLLLGLLISGLAGAGFFLYQKDQRVIRSYPPLYSANEKSVSHFIPDGAVAVLFFKGLGETWKKFSQTNFFNQLAEYRISPFITALAPPKAIGGSGYMEKVRYSLTEAAFLGTFGQDISLAIFPPQKKEKASFLMVSRTGDLFKAEEFLFHQYQKYFGTREFLVSRLGNFKVYTVPADYFGEPLYYAIAGKVVILSNAANKLRESLGIAEEGEIPRLVDSQVYEKSVGKSASSIRYGIFVDNKRLAKFSALPEGSDAGLPVTSSLSRISIKNGLLIQTNFFTDSEKFPHGKDLVSASAEPLKTIRFFPSESILYFGGKGIKTSHLIDAFEGNIVKDNPLLQILLTPERAEGKSPGRFFKEEILAVLGNEWCLAAMDKGKGKDVFPGFAIAMEVNNVQKAAKIMNDLSDSKGNDPTEKRNYKEMEIRRIKNNGVFHPEYFFHDNLLFVGSDEFSINAIIDTIREEGTSLKKSAIYTASGISPNNHLLFLFNMKKFADFTKNSLQNLPEDLLAGFYKSRLSLNELIYLLSVVHSIASETVFTPGKIKSKTFIALKDLPGIRKQIAVPGKPKAAKPKAVRIEKPESKQLAIVPPVQKVEEKTASVSKEKRIAPPPREQAPSPAAEEKKVVVPEDKKEEQEITMEEEPKEDEFAYSGVYMGKAKRDPFASLIELELSKIAETVDISGLWKELSRIDPINMYIYKFLQKNEPGLIKKIEYLTRYFRNKKKLEKRSEQEIDKKFKEYSTLVDKINSDYRSKVISPLNFDFNSLILVGIIAVEKDHYALVQTSDHKGYTLRVRDIVGINYGEVVSITKNKVIIEEKNRDYTGKISTISKSIELKGEDA